MKEINTREMMKYYKEYKLAENYWSIFTSPSDSADAAKKEALNKLDAFYDVATRLTDAITAAEGKAYERTISASMILESLYEINEKLDIPTKYMDGISVNVDYHSQHFARAYKYTPMSTHFCAVFKNGTWKVTDIYRDPVRQAANSKYILTLPEAAKTAIINKYIKFN